LDCQRIARRVFAASEDAPGLMLKVVATVDEKLN